MTTNPYPNQPTHAGRGTGRIPHGVHRAVAGAGSSSYEFIPTAQYGQDPLGQGQYTDPTQGLFDPYSYSMTDADFRDARAQYQEYKKINYGKPIMSEADFVGIYQIKMSRRLAGLEGPAMQRAKELQSIARGELETEGQKQLKKDVQTYEGAAIGAGKRRGGGLAALGGQQARQRISTAGSASMEEMRREESQVALDELKNYLMERRQFGEGFMGQEQMDLVQWQEEQKKQAEEDDPWRKTANVAGDVLTWGARLAPLFT